MQKVYRCYTEKRKGFDVEAQGVLREARDKAAEDINEILIYRLQNNIRFCEICGKPLPLYAGGKVCDACRRKMRK